MTPDEEEEVLRMKKWAALDFNTRRHTYLLHGGTYCLYCGSPHINADRIDPDGREGYSTVTCETCNSTFRDIWRLADVDEVFDGRHPNPPM